MVEVLPSRETLGAMLRRLRLSKGWSQKQLERQIDVDQGRLSNYERDVNIPDPELLDRLNDLYGLPPETLSKKAWEEERHRRLPQPEPVPGRSVAIPNEPALIDAVRALFLLETEHLPDVTRFIRMEAERQQKRERERQHERPERDQAAG